MYLHFVSTKLQIEHIIETTPKCIIIMEQTVNQTREGHCAPPSPKEGQDTTKEEYVRTYRTGAPPWEANMNVCTS